MSSTKLTTNKEYYHLLRRIELTQKYGLVLKWLVLFLTVSVMLIAGLLLGCFLFSDSTRSTMYNSGQRLATMSTLIDLQYNLRSVANTLLRQFSVLSAIFEPQLVGKVLPEPATRYSTSALQGFYSNVESVYSDTPEDTYLRLSNLGLLDDIDGLAQSITQFELSRYANTLFDTETKYLQNVLANISMLKPITFEDSETFSNVGLTEAIRSVTTYTSKAVPLLKDVEPYMIGKEPPFNMPEEVANKLAQAVLMEVNAISNIVGSLISGVDYVANQLSDALLFVDEKRFNSQFWTATSLLALGIGAYICLFGMSGIRIDRALKQTTMMYQLLKVNEAESHLRYYARLFESLTLHALNEESMISDFMKIDKVPDLMSRDNNNAVYSNTKGKIKKLSRRLGIISNNISVGGTVVLLATSFITLLTIASLCLSLVIVGLNLKSFLDSEQFYIESFNVMGQINQQYLIFYTLATLGNFIKIDGKYPEDVWNSYNGGVHSFIDFWSSNVADLPNHMYPDDIEMLNSLLLGDVCAKLDQDTYLEQYIHTICLDHLSARKGIMAFLLEEGDAYDLLSESELPAHTSYMQATKTNYTRSVFSDVLLKESVIRTFQLHYSLMGIFRNHIMTSLVTRMDARIATYETQVSYLVNIGTVVVCLALSVGLMVTYSALKQDLRVALESGTTIRPNVVKINPFIQRHLSETFFNFVKV